MTHQPYLDWLLADPHRPEEVLTADQQVALQGHLAACAECSRMAAAWQAVDRELQAAPARGPQAGFTARWQARLDVDRQKQRRRQSMTMFGVSLGLALVLFVLLTALAWPVIQSPRLLLMTYIFQLIRWASLFGAVQQFTAGILRGVVSGLSPLGLIFSAGGLCLAAVLWVVSYRVLTDPERISIRSEIK